MAPVRQLSFASTRTVSGMSHDPRINATGNPGVAPTDLLLILLVAAFDCILGLISSSSLPRSAENLGFSRRKER